MKKTPTRANETGVLVEQLSFLPPPPFCPTWPNQNTLPYAALSLLMNGQKISHPDFENSTQSWRLGAAIFQLRTLGWPVKKIGVPSPTVENPHRTIAWYFLDSKHIAMTLDVKGAGYGQKS